MDGVLNSHVSRMLLVQNPLIHLLWKSCCRTITSFASYRKCRLDYFNTSIIKSISVISPLTTTCFRWRTWHFWFRYLWITSITTLTTIQAVSAWFGMRNIDWRCCNWCFGHALSTWLTKLLKFTLHIKGRSSRHGDIGNLIHVFLSMIEFLACNYVGLPPSASSFDRSEVVKTVQPMPWVVVIGIPPTIDDAVVNQVRAHTD